MNAIEKIIAQMNEQAAAEQTTLEQAEKERIDAEFQAELAHMTGEFEKQKIKQTSSIDNKYRQLHNRQQVEIRRDTLNEKQQFLAKLFDRAAEEMENWTPEVALTFTDQALATIPLKGTATFIPGDKSLSYYTSAWLQNKNQDLPYTLEYSTEVIPGRAGFVIDDQGVQYNFIFKNLVNDVQERMAFEIAEQLFE